MHAPFRVVATPHFERDLRKLTRRHPELLPLYEELLTILRHDPHNRTGRHDIKKLSGVKSGEGQWRIRTGDYRLRYDIIQREVILYSFRPRQEVYSRGKS